MEELAAIASRALELEGETFGGRANLVLILAVLILTSTQGMLRWALERTSVRIGTWFTWEGRTPGLSRPTLRSTLLWTIVTFLLCYAGLELVDRIGERYRIQKDDQAAVGWACCPVE